MRFQVPGLLLVAALTWVTTGVAWQDPPAGQRDPGRPPRDDDGPGGPPPPPPFGPPPHPLFIAIDLDGDGELSAKEIARASESIARLDRNKDGIITVDEVRPTPPPGVRRGPGGPPGLGGGPANPDAFADSVMRFDKNGDGKITAKELPDRMARMLDQGDTNKDGALQRSEVEALSRRQPPRRPGPPGGGPPGPPFGGPEGEPGFDGPPPPPLGDSPGDDDHGRPVAQVARDLGVTPEQFRAAFRKVRPAPAGQQPTEAQRRANRKVLSESLGVSPERLDAVMDNYRPGGRGDNGPPPPPPRGGDRP